MGGTEVGRLAAATILDAVSVFDPDADDLANAAVTEAALQRLAEIGAIRAIYDETSDSVHVDVTDLLGGVLVLVIRLLREIELASDLDADELLHGRFPAAGRPRSRCLSSFLSPS